MIRDLRYAGLTLLRSPIFTLTATVALALGCLCCRIGLDRGGGCLVVGQL